MDRTLQDEQAIVANRQVEGFEDLVETLVTVGFELGFDRAFLGALTDDRLCGAVAREERKRAEQDGLARASLTRDHREARTQFELGAIHQGEVADLKAADHAEGRLPNKAEPTRTQVEPAATADSRSPLIPIDNSGSATPKRAARESRQRRSSAKVRSATAGSSESGAMAISPFTTKAGWAKAKPKPPGGLRTPKKPGEVKKKWVETPKSARPVTAQRDRVDNPYAKKPTAGGAKPSVAGSARGFAKPGGKTARPKSHCRRVAGCPPCPV